MATTVLVAYATKYCSTQEVAEAIATTLHEHGLEVEVRPAREVRSLQGYDLVVLGAALYIGRWHADARHFLKRHHTVLSSLQSRFLLSARSTLPKSSGMTLAPSSTRHWQRNSGSLRSM